MIKVVRNLLPLFFSLCLLSAIGQPPKNTKTNQTAAPKSKLPKLTSILGSYKDSVNVTVEEALTAINQQLQITDDKKIPYTVYSYQFLYKRASVTEDEATGKVTPVNSIVANLFKTTPLPELWRTLISQQLRTGEELYFFDVIAKDATGRLFFAPNLKIEIK